MTDAWDGMGWDRLH